MENIRSTHPLILVAAGAVTVAALAATAHFAGLIPGKTAEPAAQIATAPAPNPPATLSPPAIGQMAAAATPPAQTETTLNIPAGSSVTITPEGSKPAIKPVKKPVSEPVRRPRHTASTRDPDLHRIKNQDSGIDVIPSSQRAVVAPPLCRECGTVENVQEMNVKGEGSGLGAVAGGVLGGVLGHQVGKGHGKDAATVIGAIGGALGGHQIEKNVRTEKQYQVTVRFDDGTTRTYTQTNTNWRQGDRVRLDNGTLSAL